MGNEEWRPVPGYEGAYRVSDGGRVMSYTGKVSSIDDSGCVGLCDGLRPVRVDVAELVETVFFG